MALSRLQKFSTVAALTATALGMNLSPANDFSLASPAQAQTTQEVMRPSRMGLDQCYKREAVLAGLDAEQQSIMVAGEFPGTDGNTGERINLKFAFTANASDMSPTSRGYHMYSNTKGELCKGKDFDNIKILEGRRGQIDTRAYFQPISQAPEGSMNRGLQNIQQNGHQVPFYQARDIHSGELTTVTGQYRAGAQGLQGGLSISSASGKALVYKLLENVRYSEVGISVLSRPVQTASLDR